MKLLKVRGYLSFLGLGKMNKKYLDINSKFPFFLFSPYKGGENYKSDSERHNKLVKRFKDLNFNILALKDEDKTLFLYHKKEEGNLPYENVLSIAKEYEVNFLFVDILGIKLSKQESLNNILSVDYEEIK